MMVDAETPASARIFVEMRKPSEATRAIGLGSESWVAGVNAKLEESSATTSIFGVVVTAMVLERKFSPTSAAEPALINSEMYRQVSAL